MAKMIKEHESFPEPQFFHTDQSVVCHKRREICEHFSLDRDNNEVSHGDNRPLSAQNLTESSRRKIKVGFQLFHFLLVWRVEEYSVCK